MASTTEDYRLPKTVKPVHYDLVIRTDLERLAFNGKVTIRLDVLADTHEIVLNSSGLTFASTALTCDTLGSGLVATDVVEDTANERVAFKSTSVLPKGSKAVLVIVFEGSLTDSMQGYYKSAWKHEGKTAYYALTQFEASPIAARRAFPCWDEPALKAVFAITLISRQNTINLSNMPPTSEELLTPNSGRDVDSLLTAEELVQDQWKITKFQVTPLMSTYLVAYANGEFEYLETTTILPLANRTLPLRIYTTKDLIKQAEYALDIKAKVLPLYEKAFGVEFPLPKLDTLIAHDFDAGAMENWGLITGRTAAFLLDPEKSGLQARKYVATTQSHEVSHMWFGNITTMEWWTYLYLKEGFATLLGEVVIPGNSIFPEWKLDSEFITDHLENALKLDAKLSSHPIEVDCSDASHIGQIFDNLSYSKAASVLRMLLHHVGEEQFLAGVSFYLKDHLYGNGTTKDLWEGVRKATGLDIDALMDNWVSKIGYPVVSVTETQDGILVRQDRFLESGRPEPEQNETIWHIPLSILTVDEAGKSEKRAVVLDSREQTYALNTNKPFKLNAGVYGVYRVLYTPERLAQIAKEASQENSPFSLNDRVGLVIDATALSQAGLATLSSILTLIDAFKGEKEYLVWSATSQTLSEFVSIWRENQDVNGVLNAFRRSLFVPIVQRLGYDYSDNEPLDNKKLRTTAITAAAKAGEQSVIEELKRRFAQRASDPSIIPADLQRIIYSIVVKYGGKEEYDAVRTIQANPRTPTENIAAIEALGATTDPALLEATFETILTKSRDQDVTTFFRGLNHNLSAQRTVAKFFEDNYDSFNKRFEGNNKLSYLVEYVYSSFSTQADYDHAAKFFEGKDTSKYSYSLAQSLDNIRSRQAYIERSTDDLVQWLNQWKSDKAAL